MTKTKRILFVIVPCLLLLFSIVTVANAAFLGGGSVAGYWSQYNLTGSTTGGTVTQPPASPAAPATTPTATPITNPLQSYWSRLNIPWGSGNTTPAPAPAPTPTPTPPPTTTNPPADTSGLSADESLMFSLVNQEREKAGLPDYTVDMRLVNLARMKSQDMYDNNYFSHTSPTYGSAYDMEKKAGISARVMGAENIARAATTQRAQELFMGSPGHKANILNSLHDSIGIGIVKSPNGVYVTQLFLGD